MKIMTLQQFIQQQAKELQEPAYQEVLVMTVRDFLDAIEASYEGDWIACVTRDSPEPGSLSVKFKPAAEDTEQ
jgi:indole-3-glycerol phosphate synthase